MKASKQSSIILQVTSIKYADFLHQTKVYLSKQKLNNALKEELQHRINSLCQTTVDTLAQYANGKSKQSPIVYGSIESGLKELLRRVRISIALNKKQSKEFIGFWKYLSEVWLEDAVKIRDLELLSLFESFHEQVNTLKVKK